MYLAVESFQFLTFEQVLGAMFDLSFGSVCFDAKMFQCNKVNNRFDSQLNPQFPDLQAFLIITNNL